MGDLAERRAQLEMALAETESALLTVEEAQEDTETVRTALTNIQAINAHLKPFEQQKLMRRCSPELK
jgi:hypothetical protein